MSENEMEDRGTKCLSLNRKKLKLKAQRVEDGYIERYVVNVKVYSNGFLKKLSNQNPFWGK